MPPACPDVNVRCSGGSLPIYLSVAALTVAMISAFIAYRKNRNDLSAPWVQLLLGYVQEELKALHSHAILFRQICTVSFASVERKRSVVNDLYSLRDQSLQRISSLMALLPGETSTRDARAALDGVFDSFLDNEELELNEEPAKRLMGRYEEQHNRYASALRSLAKRIYNVTGRPSPS